MAQYNLDHALTEWIQTEGLKGSIPEARMNDRVVIGNFTSDLLQILQCPDHKLVTSVSVLEKMMFDHAVSARHLANLHGLICLPQKVFKSASHPNTSIVVMSNEEIRALPLLVAVHLNKSGARGKTPDHWVASAYAKDNPQILEAWEKKGLLIWEA